MAFAAIGALVAAETVTVTMALSAIAEIGTVMGVVGAVTGNNDLLKAGSIMGLVGGIGSMAVGAANSAATAATTAAADAGDMAVNYSAGGYTTEQALADMGGDVVADTASNVATVGADTAVDANMSGTLSTGQAAASGVETAGTQAYGQSGQMAVGAPAATVNDVAGAQAVKGATAPGDISSPFMRSIEPGWNPQTAPKDSGGFFSSISDFAEKNKTLFNSGMMIVGGAMSGANQRDMWEQKKALDQQELNQRGYGSAVGNFAPRGILATGAR